MDYLSIVTKDQIDKLLTKAQSDQRKRTRNDKLSQRSFRLDGFRSWKLGYLDGNLCQE